MRQVLSSIRALRIVMFTCLPIWLGSAVLSLADDGPLRPFWIVTWMVAFVVFQVALWRAMWLWNQPRMPHDD